jgi:hypothetical protein
MKPLWWALAAFIVIAFPVRASDDPSIHKVSIGGSGANPCSAWTQDRSGTTDAARQASQSRIDWISGFFPPSICSLNNPVAFMAALMTVMG